MATKTTDFSSKSNAELETAIEALLDMLDKASDETARLILNNSIERVSEEMRIRASKAIHLALAA